MSLPAGTRVRHYGEQYPRALSEGTGNIVEVADNGRYVEYLVERDVAAHTLIFGSITGLPCKSWWAANATIPISQSNESMIREQVK